MFVVAWSEQIVHESWWTSYYFSFLPQEGLALSLLWFLWAAHLMAFLWPSLLSSVWWFWPLALIFGFFCFLLLLYRTHAMSTQINVWKRKKKEKKAHHSFNSLKKKKIFSFPGWFWRVCTMLSELGVLQRHKNKIK